MLSPSSSNNNPDPKVLLLRQAVELFTEELSAITGQKWEELPELKKRKVVLAGRFGGLDWGPDPAGPEPFDLWNFKTMMAELETQSRQKIQEQLDLLAKQICAMQELRQFWRESLSVSFRKFCEANRPILP